jgi:hypothetical protein
MHSCRVEAAMLSSRRSLLFAAIPLLLISLTSCSDSAGPAAPSEPGVASVIVSANVAGTPIDLLVVTVTAPDIPVPLVFNFQVVEGTAQGTLKLPPGQDRLISVEAFDDEGEVTHEGSATVSVNAGMNNAVIIPLRPRAGQVPVVMSMGSFAVWFSSAPSGAFLGESAQFDAYIVTDEGMFVEGTVQWATTNPAIATINSDGLATAVRKGSVQIVATFEGFAAVANFFATDDNLAGYYHGNTYISATGGLAAQVGESFLTEALFGCSANTACETWGDLSSNPGGYDFYLYLPNVSLWGALTKTTPYDLTLNEIVYQTTVTITSPTTVTCTSIPAPIFPWYFAVNPTLSTAGMPVTFNCSGTDAVMGTLSADIHFEIGMERLFPY